MTIIIILIILAVGIAGALMSACILSGKMRNKMTTTISTSGSNSTVTIRYTATSQRVIDTLTAAAEYWHNLSGSEIAFADLTQAQKLEVVDTYILKVVQDAAKTQHILAAQKTATDTAQGELPGKFM